MKFSRSLLRSIFIFFLSFLLVITIPVIAVQGQPPQDILQQARTLYDAGKFREVVPLLQQAVKSFSATSDRLNQAMALGNLAATWQQLAQWQQAEESVNSSLSLLASLEETPEQQRVLAQTLDIQRQLQQERGRLQDALDTGERISKIYQKLGAKAQLAQSQIHQSLTLQALGLYPRACKTLLNIYQQETATCEITPVLLETWKSQTPSVSHLSALNSLGHTLRVLGQLDESRLVLTTALEIAQSLNLPQEQAAIYLNIGNTERVLANQPDLDSPQKAELVNTALAAYTRSAQLATRTDTQIKANLNRLSLLTEQKNWSEAETMGRSLINQVPQFPVNKAGLAAQINLAQSLISLVEGFSNTSFSYREIEQLLDRTNQGANQLGDPLTQAYILLSQGRLFELEQKWTLAEARTKQALNYAPSYQSPDVAYQLLWQMGRIRKAQGDKEEAIANYTQAVNVLSSLRGDLVTVNPNVQFSFRESVEPIYRQLVELLLEEKNPSQNQLQLARQTIESLQLAELDNFFRDACANAKPKFIDQVDTQAAVIYPIILSDRLEVILSVPGQPLRKYTTYQSQTELENTFKQTRVSLRRTAFPKEQLQVAQKLYDWLIRPTEQDLAANGIKTLVFVLDGYLRNLPMAVLHDGQKYLIQKYNLALTPGLQLIQSQPLKQTQLKVLIAGLTAARQGFPALPGVASEIKQISGKIPTNQLIDQNFLKASLQKEIKTQSFPIVHLATHGLFSSSATDTFILAWDERINVKELDQLLRSRSAENREPIELL
ncbi:MAG TPA: CHAT domain-containing protein, partial [Nostocaceae cyanobacterium]|nr:CHAT domain-containing protein [Nostocaceae cyanobacterium]